MTAYRDTDYSVVAIPSGSGMAFGPSSSTVYLVSFEYKDNVYNIDDCSVWDSYHNHINEIIPAKLEVNNYEDGTQTIAIVAE